MIDGLVPNGELTKKADEVEVALAQFSLEWHCERCNASGPIIHPDRDVLAVAVDISDAHAEKSPICMQSARLIRIRPRGPTVALCPYCTTGTLVLLHPSNDISCEECGRRWYSDDHASKTQIQRENRFEGNIVIRSSPESVVEA